MLHFQSSIVIDAPIEKVWAVLSNVAAYANWPSGVTKVEGTPAVGSVIKLYSEVSPGRAFPLKVTQFEPNVGMTFKSGMPLGLFTGTRTYKLTPSGSSVQFEMQESYTGLMAPLITKTIPDLGPSFVKFAAGLKATAESN